jgi:hypothetical protein
MIGRPETHPVKKIIGFSDNMLSAVERWRAKQKPVPNLSEAIRRLVELGLKSPAKALKKGRPDKTMKDSDGRIIPTKPER